MNSITILLTVALCGAVWADPIPRNLHQQRKPDGECPSKDGELPTYLPDMDDCQIFYECSGGEAVQKECMEGLCFDTTLNVCAFPPHKTVRKPVGECPAKDPANPVYLPDSESCSIYYECSGGVAIQNECPPDMEFNPVLDVCDFPIDSGCAAQNSTKTAEVLSVLPQSAVGTCPPRDTDVPVFLSDSEDCTIYYLCSNGQAIQGACAPGMAWNSKLNTCDWEIDVECPNSKKLVRSVGGTCPTDDSQMAAVFFPDTESCTTYYECSAGVAIRNECPPDLEFNPKLNVCDFPWRAGCSVEQK